MADQATELFRRRIAQYDTISEKLRTVLKMIEDDPSFAVELATLLSHPEASGLVYPPRLGRDVPDNPALEPVLDVFKDRPGEWLSIAEVVEVCGITRGRVRWLIEGSKHRTMFEWKIGFPSKKRLYRLKEETDSPVAETPPPKLKRKAPKKRMTEDRAQDSQEKVGEPKIIRPKWGKPGLAFEQIEGGDGDTRRVN